MPGSQMVRWPSTAPRRAGCPSVASPQLACRSSACVDVVLAARSELGLAGVCVRTHQSSGPSRSRTDGSSHLAADRRTSCANRNAVCRRLGLELPSEAQWEYGTRGGTTTAWWTGRARESLVGAVNLAGQSAARAGAPWQEIKDWPELDDGFAVHAPVDAFRPNPLGLHDVHGNLWEWCHANRASAVRRRGTTSVPRPRARPSACSAAAASIPLPSSRVRPLASPAGLSSPSSTSGCGQRGASRPDLPGPAPSVIPSSA